MKIINDGGYSKDDRDSYKEIIFSNTIQSMRVIIEAMEKLEIPYENAESKVDALEAAKIFILKRSDLIYY